jgi:trigger factor
LHRFEYETGRESMQVTVEEQSSVKKTLHIEIPEDQITKEIDKAYAELKKRAKIKGFRPGKVPRGVLERYYGKEVNADVTSRLIQESFVEAIKEKDLKVIATPKIDPPELKAKEPYKYSAAIEIKPEIEDIDFKGLDLKKTLYSGSDKEVDTQLNMLQKNMAQNEKIEEDRPLADGDLAFIDYEGFKDGNPYPDLQKTENYLITIGKGQVLKDFDDQIIGMKPGDQKDITVTFPEDYFNKDLANIEIDFTVSLNEIRKEILPDLDDELAKKMGNYETLEDLKAAIRQNLDSEYKKRAEQEINEQMFETLLEKTDFEVPESMIEFELEGIVKDAENYFSHHNVEMADAGITRDKLSEQYRDLAVKQVKRHLILDKIINQEDLTLSDEDQDAGFQEMSNSLGQPAEQIKAHYQQNQEQLEHFKQALLEKQAISLIIENGTVEEVEPETSQPSEQEETDEKTE